MFNIKVHPEHLEHGDEDAWKINGYPRRAAAGEWDRALSLKEAIGTLLRFIQEDGGPVLLVGHNFFFDWTFIVIALALAGIQEAELASYVHYTKLDTRSMAVGTLLKPGELYDPGDYSIRNNKIAKLLGIPPEPYPHQALGGAKQSYFIFKKLLELKGGQ